MDAKTEARFWSKVDRSDVKGCWVWTGTLSAGYGRFFLHSASAGRSLPRAHRVAWWLTNGPMDASLVLDHLCRNKACVNPAHLEQVEQAANVHRGDGPTAQNARKTRCVHGHPFDAKNTKTNPNGGRVCRTCKRIRRRVYSAR